MNVWVPGGQKDMLALLSPSPIRLRLPSPSPRPWRMLSATPSSVHLAPPAEDGRRALLREETSRISRLRLRRLIESGKLDDAVQFLAAMRCRGIQFGAVVESVLITALMRSGLISAALLVFEGVRERNVVTWTSVMSGCVQNGRPEMAFPLLVDMMESGVLPNEFSFNAALQACGSMAALAQGVQVHSLVIRFGLEDDARIGNCLIDFYARCGSMDEAVRVFDSIPAPDVVTFTSLIGGFCKNKLLDSAAGAFLDLVRSGVAPNEHTLATVLTGCDAELGKQVHAHMIKTGIQRNVYASSALIEFYSRHDSLGEAREVFSKLGEAKSVVTWSSMISCCFRDGREEDAVRVFYEMIVSPDAPRPNEFTYAALVGGCGNRPELLPLGRQLHGATVKLGFSSDKRICNALISMYSRNGRVTESESLFERCAAPDVVTWSGVISGYFQNGFHELSASFLCRMHSGGFKPNEYALSSAISSCGNLSLLDQGRQLHSLALKSGCDLNVSVGNALISMYSKCGSAGDATSAFNAMPARDTASWNSLIHGYAQAGLSRDALQLFDDMLSSTPPDDATFVAVLAACSHAGKPDQALRYLESMENPSLSHYICTIDALGRAGKLAEAAKILLEMPFEADSLAWKTLLAACRRHGSIELGELAARKVMEMAPEDSGGYVLLSNLLATKGEWEEVKRVRMMMEERGVRKEAACSWTEVGNKVHAFVSTDKSHPCTDAIYGVLEELSKQMREEGYLPLLVSADLES